jgi:hypothetical protein
MFSLFKRKTSPEAELTFKTRVQSFWDWYRQVAPRFYQTIEAGKCPSLAEEVSGKVDELIRGFAWVFGPGEGGKGHSFTLSGEGNPHRQLLAIFWHSQAPKLDGWTFYPARQPTDIKGRRIHIGERVFDPIEFWLTTHLDRDRQKVDITVWHPMFATMEERDRWGALFLFLDDALGEYGTQQWIGEIKLNDQHLAEAIPLQELRGFIDKIGAEMKWENFSKEQVGVVYNCEPRDGFLRSDVFVGSSSHYPLIKDYLAADGDLADPLAGTGADFVFVSFDSGILTAGKETEIRGRFEDALNDALEPAAAGHSLGGAIGRHQAYIDLVLFDGARSLAIVQQVLHEQQLPAGSAIHFFAKEKRGQEVVL